MALQDMFEIFISDFLASFCESFYDVGWSDISAAVSIKVFKERP
jgi:hypothetical protein